MPSFKHLKEGDHAYSIVRSRGRKPYAVVERVSGPGGGPYLRTLPCYSDGTPMIYFSTLWCADSGREVRLPQHGDRPMRRLVLELPAGIECVPNPNAATGAATVPQDTRPARRKSAPSGTLNHTQRARLRESGLRVGDSVIGRWLDGRSATITRFRPCGDRFVDAVLERDGRQIGWCGIDSLKAPPPSRWKQDEGAPVGGNAEVRR